MDNIVHSKQFKSVAESRDEDAAQWIFDGLKPLRAACNGPEFAFLAYLLEMSEAEAHRLATAMRRQGTSR